MRMYITILHINLDRQLICIVEIMTTYIYTCYFCCYVFILLDFLEKGLNNFFSIHPVCFSGFGSWTAERHGGAAGFPKGLDRWSIFDLADAKRQLEYVHYVHGYVLVYLLMYFI